MPPPAPTCPNELAEALRKGDHFWDLVSLICRYEMEQGDDVWLCTYKLKEIGCDLEKWEKERGDQ